MNVIDALKAERDLLHELQETVIREKETLINNNIEELKILTEKKESLKKLIDKAEYDRINLCGKKNLKEIIPCFEGQQREEIESVGKDMEDIVYRIQEANETNQLLIKQSLNYTRLVINLLSPKKAATYNPSGRIGDTNVSNSILNKSV